MVSSYALTHPVASLSRGIENVVITGKNSKNFIVRTGCAVFSRAISVTVFPAFLALELTFKRVPKLIVSIGDKEKFSKRSDKIVKYVLAFLCSPLGLHSPEGVPGFFLKSREPSAVRPFGVEKQYGKQVDAIFYPRSVKELQTLVQQARREGKQVSVIGAGMSQGTQTVPKDSEQIVIHTKHLNKIRHSRDGKTVSVQAGATWEQLQMALNEQGKSVIVKQASDLFSIGGSIAINCHGWAHEYGAIASTVESLDIIDAHGKLRRLTPKDELFRCQFGTLGYFGVIVGIRLKIVDNEHLVEKTEEVDLDQFVTRYKTEIKGKDIPLFGGRLVLDSRDGNPLRKVCMVRYERDTSRPPTRTETFSQEAKQGTRVERIGLKLMSHLSHFSSRRLTSWFWKQERAHMLQGRRLTRNEALHPPINAFTMLHHSNLHAQWLQEYFISEENLPNFLRFLGAELKANDVRLINATIRPTPRDRVSVLPYAEKDRYAVVLCFAQEKTKEGIARTRKWMESVNQYVVSQGDVYYQAYMPYATREQFEKCYGKARVERLRKLKAKYDPRHVFGNAHTAKYFDRIPHRNAVSSFRRVFQTSEQMKTEFVKFLQTIFYQLDDKKVLAAMEEILDDPTKTDEEIYEALLDRIEGMKKSFAPLRQLFSLGVLKQGMGKQAAALLKNFKKDAFQDYLEVYNRRYLNVIRKIAGLPLGGTRAAVCDLSTVTFADRLEAGAVGSAFPYKTHIPLNDPDCADPLEHPEHTHKPLGDELPDQSLDLIACLGGLHHVPKERVDAFTASLRRKLRPGGVILLRDHNVGDACGAAKLPKGDIRAIASVVHSFVNASNGVSWKAERKEVREFRSAEQWTALMKRHGFTRISRENLVLKDDPTENGMMAFVRTPENLEEMQQALHYRSDYARPKEGTRATWIEWGNVRFSKQYAEFIQTHHAYAFDYIGHLRQHWQHFYHYVKESRQAGISLKDLIFSGNFAMNLFILFTAAIQCAAGQVMSLPSMGIARWKQGAQWRTVAHLTDLEKYQAQVEKEYSEFIDHTPFYQFDYIGKIKQLWRRVQVGNILSATFWTLELLAKAAISLPIRALYTSEEYVEPDTIKVLIKDPNNELSSLISHWEREKDPEHDKNHKIEVVYTTPDGYKLVSFPRYKTFTKICGYLTQSSAVEVLEIGGQKEVSVDVLLEEAIPTPKIARVVYEMEKLQDPAKRRYITYQVHVSALKRFQRYFGTQRIEYIHE